MWRWTSVQVLRANKEISLKGTEAYVCCIKRGSPVSSATCPVQAAEQGEPGIMGKRKGGNAEESVKIDPDSRELSGFAGTDTILLSVLFFREDTNSVLTVISQPLWLPDGNPPPHTHTHSPPITCPLCGSPCLFSFFLEELRMRRNS